MGNNRYYSEPELTAARAQGYGARSGYDPASYRPDMQFPNPAVHGGHAGYAGHGGFDGHGGYHGYDGAAHAPYPPYPGHAQARPQQPAPPVSDHAPITMTGVTHALGAVLSVALIVGALGWAWQLMKRDVAGVPVVRALEGPIRVIPEDPGGRQAAHQGLAVNELAAAQDDLQRDQIVLAPAPLELAEEDMRPIQPPAQMPPLPTLDQSEQPIPVALTQELAGESTASALGMRNPSRRAVTNSPRPPARDGAVVAQSRASAQQSPSAGTGSVDDLAANLAQTVAAGLSAVREIDIDPASIGPGTRLVQLGAYDDVETARAAWDQLARRFAPLLDDRGRVIEAAHSGGSVFYRLRAHGFTDERDARRFCAALVDQQIDCIPVLIR